MIGTGSTQNAQTLVRAVQGRSLWRDAWQRLTKNRAAMASIAVLALVALTAIFAPLLSSYRYDEINYDLITCAPGWWPGTAACTAPGHIFGTDAVGRDLFVRVLYGARMSLAVGLVATLVSLLIGVSRKSMFGQLLGRPVDARLPGALAVAAIAVWQGAAIVRVHDVQATVDAVRVAHALRQSRNA